MIMQKWPPGAHFWVDFQFSNANLKFKQFAIKAIIAIFWSDVSFRRKLKPKKGPLQNLGQNSHFCPAKSAFAAP